MGRCNICGQTNGHAEGCPNSGNVVNDSNSFNYRGGEIRCNLCQTMNPPGSKKCRGCGASLESSIVHNHDFEKENKGGYTIREESEMRQPTQREDSSEVINSCPNCGYPLRPGSSECPSCHCKDLNKKPIIEKNSNKSEAVWNISNSEFRIGLCDKNGEISDAKAFSTDDIVLGREELLPGNNNLSRKHIHITNDGGQWYIEDVSSTHQTYLVVKGKTLIEDGDVLVLGNKFFRFKTK